MLSMIFLSNLKGSFARRRATACHGTLNDPYRIEKKGGNIPEYPGLPSVGLSWKSEAVSLEESANPKVSTRFKSGGCSGSNSKRAGGPLLKTSLNAYSNAATSRTSMA